MIKKLFSFILVSCILYLLSSPVMATNATITCDSSSCTKSTGTDPLFYEENILPGFSATRQVEVVNNRGDDCNLYFKAYNPRFDILADKIFITHASVTQTLRDFTDNTNYFLGTLTPGQTATYSWQALFDPTAGNEYQNKQVIFDLDFTFECDLLPTPTPTSTSGTSTGDGGDSGGGSPPGPSVCNDPYPLAPTGFYARRNVGGASATLFWNHSTSPHTHYLIAFGVRSGEYLYGNPNVGDVNYYTVRSLVPGAQYCFYVRTINGCMPGDRTAEYCINPGGPEIVPATPPTGFESGVLGEQTTTPPTSSDTGDIGGVTTSSCQIYWLPILYLVALIINLLYLHRQAELNPDQRSLWRFLLPPILSLFLYWIDAYLLQSRCCLITPLYCRYFWIGNILSTLIPAWFYHKIKAK